MENDVILHFSILHKLFLLTLQVNKKQTINT